MNLEQEPEATRRDTGETESSRANRGWWDRNADEYQNEHGTFLGDDRFVWCPEGLDEVEAGLLGAAGGAARAGRPGDRRGRGTVLTLAGGAGRPPGRAGPLPPPAPARAADRRGPRRRDLPLVEADAGALPFRGRFLRPGLLRVRRDPLRRRPGGGVPRGPAGAAAGRPLGLLRDAPDPLGVPRRAGPRGPPVASSYFDRTPYVEQDDQGGAVYVEHHRTVGDRVRDVIAGGFRLVDLVEPEWPDWNSQEWGGWSPLRGS